MYIFNCIFTAVNMQLKMRMYVTPMKRLKKSAILDIILILYNIDIVNSTGNSGILFTIGPVIYG